MPTFNEREVIQASVEKLFDAQPGLDLIIIDDSSPDGTGELADKIAAGDSRVSVIHRKSKNGLGRAYAQGFQVALDRGYQRIVQMDADGSHQAHDLAGLLASDADLVIGSRWVVGGEVQNWPSYRQWISKAGNAYARFAIGSELKDVTAGYRVYSAELASKLPLEKIQAHGYGFQVEMTKLSMALGAQIAEVPITFIEREGGRSKMTTGIIIEAFALCTKWLLQRLARR
ncbi:MAG TPA: polyprenol monophosphomannose synthase [Aquiluna sp.]